jgi:hypothetical protein
VQRAAGASCATGAVAGAAPPAAVTAGPASHAPAGAGGTGVDGARAAGRDLHSPAESPRETVEEPRMTDFVLIPARAAHASVFDRHSERQKELEGPIGVNLALVQWVEFYPANNVVYLLFSPDRHMRIRFAGQAEYDTFVARLDG